MQRAEILDAAKKCVCGQRVQDYGKPEDNFRQIADLWNAYVGGEPQFGPLDVAIMLSLLKVARIRTGTGTDDCFVDLAGYAACAGEIADREREKKAREIITPELKKRLVEVAIRTVSAPSGKSPMDDLWIKEDKSDGDEN